MAYRAEPQASLANGRDCARTEHVEELTEILIQHFGGSGIAFLWEQQLLNTRVPSNAG
ncbi:Small molecule metabolism (plasmid) [Sinorhizobium sp. CCBAU 05631]|nr:Small molecule metabolism [Sinorhizobium sp. CCBAU 05631]